MPLRQLPQNLFLKWALPAANPGQHSESSPLSSPPQHRTQADSSSVLAPSSAAPAGASWPSRPAANWPRSMLSLVFCVEKDGGDRTEGFSSMRMDRVADHREQMIEVRRERAPSDCTTLWVELDYSVTAMYCNGPTPRSLLAPIPS